MKKKNKVTQTGRESLGHRWEAISQGTWVIGTFALSSTVFSR